MDKNIKKIIIIFIIFIIAIVVALLVLSIINNTKEEFEKLPGDIVEGSPNAPDEGINNYQIQIEGLDEEIKSKIGNIDEFTEKMAEYIYKNGLVDHTSVKYINYSESNNILKIKFKLEGSNKENLIARINLNDNSYEFLTDSINNFDYSIVKYCIENYLSSINKNNSNFYDRTDDTYDENPQKEKIYSILSQDYIDSNNITKNNLNNYIKMVDEQKIFYPLEIEIISDSNLKTYKVKGIAQNIEIKNSETLYYIVNIFTENETFSIEPLDEKQYSEDKKININSIKENDYNLYDEIDVADDEVAIECIDAYKSLTITNPKYTYEKIDEEYRKIKFNSLEKYQKYVRDNYEKLSKTVATQYKTDENDQYVIKDQYGNTYIFNVNNPIDYTLILDTYTIDIPEVTEKYNKSSAKEKVGMNINKIFSAINQKDYTYIYGKLDETFKSNNYKTEQVLENYLKTNLYDQNKISFGAYEERDGIHIFVVKVANYDNESETKNMKIIMQLNEGTDYVMSFSME